MKCTCELSETGFVHGGRVCETHFKWAEEAVLHEREACAKIADAKALEFRSAEYLAGQELRPFAESFACGQVAATIRARENA